MCASPCGIISQTKMVDYSFIYGLHVKPDISNHLHWNHVLQVSVVLCAGLRGG